MTSNVKSFKISLSKHSAVFGEDANRRLRTLVVGAFRDIIEGSPVDTGRFRANWVLGVGTRNTSITDATDQTKMGAGSAKSTQILQDVDKTLTGISFTKGTAKKLFITNNLPYAEALEAGHSSQNKNFVKRAVQRLKAFSKI